jgi:hypothetical protein
LPFPSGFVVTKLVEFSIALLIKIEIPRVLMVNMSRGSMRRPSVSTGSASAARPCPALPWIEVPQRVDGEHIARIDAAASL